MVFDYLHMPVLGVVVPSPSDDWRPVDKFNRFSHTAGWGTRWVLLCLWFWVCVHMCYRQTHPTFPLFDIFLHLLSLTLRHPPPPSLKCSIPHTYMHTHRLINPVHVNLVLAEELEHEHILTFFCSFLHSVFQALFVTVCKHSWQEKNSNYGRTLWLSLFSLVSLIAPSYRCKWPEQWTRCCLYKAGWGHIISCEDPGGRGWAVWTAGINHNVIASLFVNKTWQVMETNSYSWDYFLLIAHQFDHQQCQS